MVSFAGMAGAAAPRWAAAWMVSSSTSWVRKGRAPSWMAMRVAAGAVSCKPAWTESIRSSPPFTNRRTLENPC